MEHYKVEDYLELREYLINKFTPLYTINDKAHQIDHVIDVCDRALRINTEFDLRQDPRYIVIAALSHDLFTWSRSNHQFLAYQYIVSLKESWINQFDEKERQLIALACLEHRASYKGYYTSMLSELIAAADRGDPTELKEKIKRCFDYGVDKLKQSPKEALLRVIPHLQDKYLNKAYGNNPPLFYRVYGAGITDLQNTLKTLTLEHELFKDYIQYL
jgi:HD superfamily phosphodiesterase